MVNILNLFFLLLSLAVFLIWTIRRSIVALHLLQLDSYSNSRLLKWLWKGPFTKFFDSYSILICSILSGIFIFFKFLDLPAKNILILAFWSVLAIFTFFHKKRPENKKPLVYTGRAIRIFVLTLIISTAFSAIVFLSIIYDIVPPQIDISPWVLLNGLVLIHLAPLIIIISNLLLYPVQTTINNVYLIKAKRKLRTISPRVIGITGSYGKTSTKNILAILLNERFPTLMTPQSFNTLMGISRTINENLSEEHKIFLVEMGAYRLGDIREISALVNPQVGMITAIGPQHLERFKTLQGIEKAKYELIESLPNSGVAIFNYDDIRCRKLADITSRVKVLRYGLDNSQGNLALWAKGISQSSKGTSFTLVDREGREKPVSTVLLGMHNVSNIIGAACISLEMGLNLEDISKGIVKIRSTPHRLQTIIGNGGVLVIDDSYNSNPVGSREALNVLSRFDSGRRILVTPGMVELGISEDTYNQDFGAHAAKICDYVILVGLGQTRAIFKGLMNEGFSADKVRLVNTFDEANHQLQGFIRPGDTVLFENDLPDLYSKTGLF
jgi:UDP-N-acetylmuramoyl-tripeptide--D-alanyl-D-alanine ligase